MRLQVFHQLLPGQKQLEPQPPQLPVGPGGDLCRRSLFLAGPVEPAALPRRRSGCASAAPAAGRWARSRSPRAAASAQTPLRSAPLPARSRSLRRYESPQRSDSLRRARPALPLCRPLSRRRSGQSGPGSAPSAPTAKAARRARTACRDYTTRRKTRRLGSAWRRWLASWLRSATHDWVRAEPDWLRRSAPAVG